MHPGTPMFLRSHPGFDTIQEELSQPKSSWECVDFNHDYETLGEATCNYGHACGSVHIAAEFGRPLVIAVFYGDNHILIKRSSSGWDLSEVTLESNAVPELAALMERLLDLAGPSTAASDNQLATQIARMFNDNK